MGLEARKGGGLRETLGCATREGLPSGEVRRGQGENPERE
jgi:hypothetical protein